MIGIPKFPSETSRSKKWRNFTKNFVIQVYDTSIRLFHKKLFKSLKIQFRVCKMSNEKELNSAGVKLHVRESMRATRREWTRSPTGATSRIFGRLHADVSRNETCVSRHTGESFGGGRFQVQLEVGISTKW